MAYDQLKLENQLCFPVYAASRLITKAYQPYLDELGITYPQYLVLMVLWENDQALVNDIAKKLILQTNTITPLLKRMEGQGLILRQRSEKDERKVMVKLTSKGIDLKEEAAKVPEQLITQLLDNEIDIDRLVELKDTLNDLIKLLAK